MSILKPHAGNLNQKMGPRVNSFLEGSELVLEFEFELEGEPFVEPGHTSEFQNWGLWEADVYEAFLTKSDSRLPYLEIQVSPLNQKFALLVEKPREQSSYPERVPFKSESSVKGACWKAKIRVSLEAIPGEGNKVVGNLHAIIGKQGKQREHYSLNPNLETAPDFHRPELFVDLTNPSELSGERS